MKTLIKEQLPTKADLIKQELVVMASGHKSITTTSLKVADHFQTKHSNILRRITNLMKNSRLKIEPSDYLDDLEAFTQKLESMEPGA